MEIRENRAFAREIKFVLPAAHADELRAWARLRMQPDPHAEKGAGDLYRTTSLYYDTRSFDVFYRRGSFARAKYRVRRYGDANLAFLERKLRSESGVTKRRTLVELSEISRLRDLHADPAWPGYWFHRRMLARVMAPACQVSYRRTALIGRGSGMTRLTLDEDLRARQIAEPEFHDAAGTPLLPGQAILELKFRKTMPADFEDLLGRFALQSNPVSKYRLAVSALGCLAA